MALAGLSRRGLMGGTLGAAVAGTIRSARAQQTGAIRIGVLQTLSGPQADVGKPHLLGAQLAAKQINDAGGIDGRQIELAVRDTRFDPNAAISAMHELIGNGINLFHGEAFSALVFAALPLLEGLNVVSISPAVSGMNATHDKFTRHFFRCTSNGHMQYGGQAVLAAKLAPSARRWGGIVTDTAGTRLGWDSFSAVLRHAYPKYANHPVEINQPVLVKSGAGDFRSAISELVAQKLDGIQIGMSGGEEITMLQQARPFGLFQSAEMSVEPSQITVIGPALKSGTPPHLWGFCLWYYDGYKQVPLAQRFYKDIVAETGQANVNPFTAQAHTVVMSYAGAIRAAKSTATGPVISALESTAFDSIFGPLTYRKEDHQLLVDQGYLKIEPQEADPGYRIAGFVTMPWQDLIEPPSPGVEFKEE